jgi:hypothetical protein
METLHTRRFPNPHPRNQNAFLYSDYPFREISRFDHLNNHPRSIPKQRDSSLVGLVIGTIAGIAAAVTLSSFIW